MLKRYSPIRKSFKYSAISLLCCMTSAYAQSDYAIEEVVVTAQKKSESIQDVPVAISAFNESFMKAAAIDRIDAVIGFTPGLTGKSTGTVTDWAIRGITSSDYTIGSEPSVATYVDDAYIGRNVLASSAFFDVERVEVVRGPQGTLFGRNAIAGAIAIHTNKPQDTNSFDLSLEAGNEDQQIVEAIANLAISDSMAVRGGFFTRERNTGQTELISGKERNDDNEGFRISALWTPSDNFSAQLTHQQVDFDTRVGAFHTQALIDQNYFARSISHDVPHKDQSETRGTNLRMEWALSDSVKLTSISDNRQYDFDFNQDVDGTNFALLSPAALGIGTSTSPAFGVTYNTNQEQESNSQEFRLDGGSGAIDWFVGASWFEEKVSERQSIGYNIAGTSAVPAGLLDSAHTNGKSTALALYGDLSWHLSNAFTLKLGARWTDDEKDWCTNTVGFTFNDTQGRDVCGTTESSDVSPRVVLDWQVNDDILAYASYVQGYKAGGASATAENRTGAYNPLTFAPIGEVINFVDPEQVKTVELGVKSTLIDGSLQLNASAYTSEYEQLQVLDVDNLVQVLRNAGDADISGLEVELIYQPPVDGLQIRAGASYLDTEFTNAVVNGASLRGNRLKLTPETTFNISASYLIPVSSGTVNLFAAYNWQDEQYWDIGNTVKQDAYGLLSGQIGYTHESEKWEIILKGSNLTDKDYSNGLIDFGTGLGQMSVVGLPRLYSLNFKYHWGGE